MQYFAFRSFFMLSLNHSHWDRYLGMTAAMTQVPVPTARINVFVVVGMHLLKKYLG